MDDQMPNQPYSGGSGGAGASGNQISGAADGSGSARAPRSVQGYGTGGTAQSAPQAGSEAGAQSAPWTVNPTTSPEGAGNGPVGAPLGGGPHGKHATGNVAIAEDETNESGIFTWRDLVVWCAIPILIVILLRVFLFGMYVIPSKSMEDTIMPGDRVVTTKLAPKVVSLKRGDIVVFKDPANWLAAEQTGNSTEYLIKRLIGLPGDVVACEGNGAPVTINGVAIDESSYIKPGTAPSAFAFKTTVTEGHVFVLGDNRANSADSRFHQDDGDDGLVPISDVVGVAFARYWPLNRIGWLSAHHDVFADVPDGTVKSSS